MCIPSAYNCILQVFALNNGSFQIHSGVFYSSTVISFNSGDYTKRSEMSKTLSTFFITFKIQHSYTTNKYRALAAASERRKRRRSSAFDKQRIVDAFEDQEWDYIVVLAMTELLNSNVKRNRKFNLRYSVFW